MYKRLCHAAKAIVRGRRTDLVHDFASDVICMAIEELRDGSNKPWAEYYYLRAVLFNVVMDGMRRGTGAVKGFNIEFTSRQVDSLDVALQNAVVPANQVERVDLMRVVDRLDHLSVDTSLIVQLHALGHETADVAEVMGLSVGAVTSRLNYARSLLKREGYFDDMRKKASSFNGVYRNSVNNGKPWKAQVHVNGRTVLIGTFNTAAQAATAYDAYVSEHKLCRVTNGTFAKCNE